MKYAAPYGSSDPDAPFVDRNTPGATAGSKVPARAVEDPQREIVNVIAASGFEPSDSDLHQLARAVRGQALNYVVAGGAPNALTAALTPALAAYTPGLPLRLLIAADNTGPTTLAISGLPALPIFTMRGAPVARGDLPAGSIASLICTGAAWALAGIAYSEVPILGAPLLWVRIDGDDNNDGLANTPERALATIAEAVVRLRGYSLIGDGALIRLGLAGTYQAPGDLSGTTGAITVLGDTAAPADYIISDAAAAVPNGHMLTTSGRVAVSGVTLRSTRAGATCLGAYNGGMTSADHVILLTTVAANTLVAAAYNSTISLNVGCNFRGAAGVALESRGATAIIGGAVSWSGGAAYSVCNIRCLQGGRVTMAGAGSVSGSATGQRYAATQCSVIATNGGGANFFPGSVVGAADASSSYT